MKQIGQLGSRATSVRALWHVLVFCAVLGMTSPLLAQEASRAVVQAPQDARSLLRYHLEAAPRAQAQLAAMGSTALNHETRMRAIEELRWQAYVYLQAGAEGELLPLLDGLDLIAQEAPDSAIPAALREASLADAERFRVQAACWSPDQYALGLHLAEFWASRHATASAAEAASVQSMKDYLQVRLQDREDVQGRASSLLWYPLFSLLALLGLGRLLWRHWF